MSNNEDNLHGLEDLDDTRQTSPTADQLKAIPMSEPPRKPVKRKGQVKKAKFKLADLPHEIVSHAKVFDRYGNELSNMLEFDPETGNGRRWNYAKGEAEDCYYFNGYVSVMGQEHLDEDELPKIIEDVKYTNRLMNMGIQKHGPLEEWTPTKGVDVSTKTVNIATHPKPIRCPKCQSALRMEDVIEKDGNVKQGIVCTNGSCGMKWRGIG